MLWQSKKQRNTNKCFTICTSAALYTWERMRLFFFKVNDLHIGKCSSPTPPQHQPAWPCYRAFPCSHVLQETKHWPRCDSITGLSFWGKIIPFYQPLLNNHHCTLRCSLLLCCHRAEADALHWSGTTHHRKTRLNLLLSSSLISSSWIIMHLILSDKVIIHRFPFKGAVNEQQSSVWTHPSAYTECKALGLVRWEFQVCWFWWEGCTLR